MNLNSSDVFDWSKNRAREGLALKTNRASIFVMLRCITGKNCSDKTKTIIRWKKRFYLVLTTS